MIFVPRCLHWRGDFETARLQWSACNILPALWPCGPSVGENWGGPGGAMKRRNFANEKRLVAKGLPGLGLFQRMSCVCVCLGMLSVGVLLGCCTSSVVVFATDAGGQLVLNLEYEPLKCMDYAYGKDCNFMIIK